MKIFDKNFEGAMYVSALYTPDGVRVRVYNPRPKPDWIENAKKAQEQYRVTDEEIKKVLMILINVRPGMGKSYYTQLPINKGGIKGHYERKEKLLQDMIDSGEVIYKELDKPVGRRTHAVYPAE